MGDGGQAVRAGRAGGDPPAAEHGRDARCGAAHDGGAQPQRGLRGEAAVTVEQARPDQSRAGGDLGDGLLGGAGLERAGAAGVDELERGERPDGGDHLGAACGDLWAGEALHRADRGAVGGGRGVGDPGDVPLVGHQAHQLEPGPGERRAGEVDGLARRAHRGSQGAEADPGQRGKGDVELERHADPASARAGREVGGGVEDQVQLRGLVDHERDRVQRLRRGGEAAQRPALRGRIGDQHVPCPVGDEPQGLGEGEGEDPCDAGAGEEPVEQSPHPQRLRGDAHRGAAGAAEEVVGVGVDGVEV